MSGGIATAASVPEFPAGPDAIDQPRALLAHGARLRAANADDLPWLRALYASTRSDELAAVPWPESAKRAFLDQ